VGIRAHLVGADEELITCDGPVQHYRQMPESVGCVIRRRAGEGLSSRFISVYEPYRGETWIEKVEAVSCEPDDGTAAAVRVTLTDGSVHYVFHSRSPRTAYLVDGSLQVTGQAACVVLQADGTVARAQLINGTRLALGQFAIEGPGPQDSEIAGIDYEKGTIALRDPILSPGLSPGTVLLVRGDGFSESITLREVLSPDRLSIGDEDLRVAGGAVNEIKPAESQLVPNVVGPHARPGMTVVDGRGRVQGRLKAGPNWTIDRGELGPLTPESFPAQDGEPARYAIVMAGPGDRVVVPSVTVFER